MCCISCLFIKFNDSRSIPLPRGWRLESAVFENDLRWCECSCMFVQLCSLFTLERITFLSIYQSRLTQGAFVFLSLHGWCVRLRFGEKVGRGWEWRGGVTDYPQPRWETYPSFSPWAFVWVLSYVETRRIKPQRVKHDTTKWYSYTQLIMRV